MDVLLTDLGVNLVAGLLIFVLEVLLIAIWLPSWIEQRREAKWVPVRRAMAERLTEWADDLRGVVQGAVEALEALEPLEGRGLLQERQEKVEETLRTVERVVGGWYDGMLAEIALYAPCLDANLVQLVGRYLQAARMANDWARVTQFVRSVGGISGFNAQAAGRTYDELIATVVDLNTVVGNEVADVEHAAGLVVEIKSGARVWTFMYEATGVGLGQMLEKLIATAGRVSTGASG